MAAAAKVDANPGTAHPQDQQDLSGLRVAVLIPCYNEAATIEKVIADFRAVVPASTIYVYDNNSTDDTAGRAAKAGAVVRHESRQGKGYVVRRMFADIDADIYVMVDGDDTVDAAKVPEMIARLVGDDLDMVSGARYDTHSGAYRTGHKFGNAMLTGLVSALFGRELRDMLCGFRLFSRRFVKSFPGMSAGFEIETELTIHSLELEMPVAEVEVGYWDRPAGSQSKLNTISDGFRIIWMITKLLKQERPMEVFGAIGLLSALISVVLVYPIFITFLETSEVPRFPTAILATGLMLTAFLCGACGLILDTVTRGRREAKKMRYLALQSLSARRESISRDENDTAGAQRQQGEEVS